MEILTADGFHAERCTCFYCVTSTTAEDEE
jgi:hypothetical protein